MWTAMTLRPSAARRSRHSATRGSFSLHSPQLTDQKWTSSGRPSASASAPAPVALNHSVVPHLVAQHALGVDDEQAAQRDALVLDEHAVVARHLLRDVRGERVLQALDAVLIARRAQPRAVRMHGVG